MPEGIAADLAFGEAGAALGVTALGANALEDRGVFTEAALARLTANAVDEEKLLGWLSGMAPSCGLGAGRRQLVCAGAGTGQVGEAGSGEVFRRAIAAAAATGSLRTGRLLVRLQSTGRLDVGEPLGVLLQRRVKLRKDVQPCRPPSAEAIAAEQKKLDDFVVLEAEAKGLRGRVPTAEERGDLAYFFASIGTAHDKEPTQRRDVAAPSLAADRQAQLTALAAGDLEEARKIARASFAAWGLDASAVGGVEAALASFAFDAGVVFELLGDDTEAARAYRLSSGARAKSVDRPLFGGLDRSAALLRMNEATGACGETVWPRLRRGLLRPLPETGTARLKENGFDVVRLYRGGLLTAHREALSDPRKQGGLTPTQRATIAARSNALGLEAFDERGRLFQGWADELGAAAVAPLLALSRDKQKGADDRARAIAVLGALLREPDHDPCVEPAPFQPLHVYERSVGSINATCATRSSNEESKRVAAALGELASDPDKDLRWSAVVALDAFDRELDSPALKRFLRDPFTVPQAPPEERRPIAALADRALFQRAQRAPAAAKAASPPP